LILIKIEKADLDAGTSLWSKAVLLVHQQHEIIHCMGIQLLQPFNTQLFTSTFKFLKKEK